eukprot:CAMPEP_0168763354 /NCGR_PEP_ID=MMETSP0724-20121128/24318_1 /TAXON_ID=265536 /ORGANISM="Amphiprora sp., Strain CCMP467" /LENGTH=173 /DNA_ID=CAMNT_0008812551 /DNA_START=95 /DNA_END=613 /DNA_ORIENTATION=+
MSDDSTPQDLLHAVDLGNLQEVQNILHTHPEWIDARDEEDGDTPLHVAVWKGHFHVLQNLVEQGANVNATNHKGSTPLHDASYWGKLHVTQYCGTKKGSRQCHQPGWADTAPSGQPPWPLGCCQVLGGAWRWAIFHWSKSWWNKVGDEKMLCTFATTMDRHHWIVPAARAMIW